MQPFLYCMLTCALFVCFTIGYCTIVILAYGLLFDSAWPYQLLYITEIYFWCGLKHMVAI